MNINLYIVALLFWSMPYIANAQEMLSNEEVYSKCYAKISDHPVEMNSADYKNVAAGKLDPIAACIKLLNTAMFSKKSGNKRQIANSNDMVSKSIVRTFHQFHLSWFSSLHSGAFFDPLHVFADNNEPGLFITDALFSNKHFKSITTSQEPLRGIRENSNPKPYLVNNIDMDAALIASGPMISLRPIPANKDNYLEIKGSRVPVGPLLGIQTAPVVSSILPEFLARPTLPDNLLPTALREGMSYNIADHFGGGILGSVALFANNAETFSPLDGGLNVHRRWANNIFYDLMCANLPNLKESDAAVIREYNRFAKDKSDLSFRTNKSCLRCHTSIDNLAHVSRNVRVSLTLSNAFVRDFLVDHVSPKPIRSLFSVYEHKVRAPAITPIDKDPLYQKRSPAGSLTYNDYNGKYWDEPVTGLQQFGNRMAAHDDIYVCAAKRYYYFLTGVDVPLTPIPLGADKKPKSKNDNFTFYHREKVVGIGKRLKSHGSLKTLIQEILTTPTFKARNPAEVGGN
jgi:hypothetical protein